MKHHQLHIVYIITKPALGGSQKICLSLFNGLNEHHLHAMLIAGTDDSLTDTLIKQENIFLLESLEQKSNLSSCMQDIRAFVALYKKLRELKKQYPQLTVHTHSTKAGIIGRWAALLAGIKTRVHTIHDFAFHAHQSAFKRSLFKGIELLTSLITTHFVCVSSEDVKIGLSLFPRFEKKHCIIRTAIDKQQLQLPTRQQMDFPAPSQPFIFGTIAAFKKEKNIPDVLRAFALVHKRNPMTRLEIIADKELHPNLQELARQLNLEQAVTFHGWQQQTAPLMIRWHAFVLTSLREGLPCSVIEARMLKLPVISYRTGGIHDVICHEQNGLLFEQKEWQQLAQGMLKLSEKEALHASLSAYKDDLQDFDTNQMILQHVDLYRSLFHHR